MLPRIMDARASMTKIRCNTPAVAVATALATLAAGNAASQPMEEIQVTGTRIVRSGMQTPTPVTIVSSEELDRFEPGGNVIDSLSQLPQFLNNSNAVNRGNFLGAAGSAQANLRGMGGSRTLVLVNGRRVPPSDRNSTVDTNLIPESLISRVDVVTGGASAAYGADALSGVVNFILDTEYEGFDAKVQAGQTNYGDGDNWEASFTGGLPVGERLHVTFAVESFRQDQVQGKVAALDDRDWFYRRGYVTNPNWRPSDPPGTNPQQLVLPDVHSTQFTPGGKINQPGFSYDQHTFIEDGTQTRLFVPGPIAAFGGTLSTSGGPEFEVAHLGERTNLGAEVERANAFLNLNFDLNDRTRYFVRAMRGQNYAYLHERNGGLGPSMMGIWTATIFRDNAFLPSHIRQAMIDDGLESFQFAKNGALVGRNNYQDDYTDGTEIVQDILAAGLDKQLVNDWTLSAFVQTGNSKKLALLDNILRVDRQFLAMDAVEVYPGTTTLVSEADRGTGEIICNVQRYNPTPEQLAASVADVIVTTPQGPAGIASPVGLDGTIENCVPLNPFGWGNVSHAAASYVVSDKGVNSSVRQKFAELVVSGDAFSSWYAGAIPFSVGATYREETMDQTEFPADVVALGPPRNAPDLGIRGIPIGFESGEPDLHQFSALGWSYGGDFDVWEVFGEALVPLYAPSSSSRTFNVSLAWRRSEYSRAGGLDTWKVGFDSQLTESFRLRGTLSRDVREATFAELFGIGGGGGNVNDPLFNNDTFSIYVNSGGNEALRPERADTFTFGFVYQPSRLEGLGLSVDYYDIDLSETIGNYGTQRIVEDCFYDNVLCEFVERNPTTNEITRVINTLTNINDARVSGTDLELTYSADPDFFGNASEVLQLRFLTSHLAERSTTPLGGQKQDLAGTGVYPEWTTVASINYQVGPWSAYLQHRFLDGTIINANWTEGVQVDINSLESVDWVNVGVTYALETAGGGAWEFFGSAANLFDEHPPVVPTGVGRSIPGSPGLTGLHDTIKLGRRYVLGARVRF